MARSRLAKIGTIHSRTAGLLRAGAMKEEDKPLWFDVYEAFPPKDEPRFDRPASSIPIREIFYEEDVVRAQYHRDNRNLPFVRLDNSSHMSQTQKFISAYEQLKKSGVAESELYSTAVLQTTGKPVGSKDEKSGETENRSSAIVTDDSKSGKINIDITNIFK